MYKVIGKAIINNINEFKQFIEDPNALKEFYSPKNGDSLWTRCIYSLQKTIKNVDKMMEFYNYGYSTDNYLKRNLMQHVEYNLKFNLKFDVIHYTEEFIIIYCGNEGFILPSNYFTVELYKNYDNYSIAEIKANNQITSNSLINNNALSNTTINDVKNNINKCLNQLTEYDRDADDIKNAKCDELRDLQKEIDDKLAELQKKKDDLMEILNAKKAEMELQQKKLELQLFALQSEIYSIRCYTGEVIEFIQLRSGNDASIETPLIIFQKTRFLDEDLGKMTSIYDFDFNDVKLFEDFLKFNTEAFNTFCPSDKCISLIRVSRSGSSQVHMNTIFGVLVDEVEKYHGKRIGILIRNGDNLFLGWTDEEQIRLSEDLFFTPKETITEGTKEVNTNENTSKEEYVSRYFIFSILQGLMDRKQFINLPEGVKLNFSNPDPHIIFSAADGWLEDNRYGSFNDIMDKTQGHYKVGHTIMCWERLSDGKHNNMYSWSRSFERDRNFSRRTGDVSVHSGEITKINVIDYGRWLTKYTYTHTSLDGKDYIYTTTENKGDKPNLSEGCKIIKEKDIRDEEIYISLPKDNYDYVYNGGRYTERKREARANFRLYPDEFIDLTYLNSIYIKYVITNRNLGKWEKYDYAGTIKYLNVMLEYLVKREKEEYEFISKYINIDNIEWQMYLTDWKLEKNVSNINDYQAKRFAKWLNEKVSS